MADPKLALAGIGKFHRQRIGPPPKIEAIQQDLIRVNFDPSQASARLIRLAPQAKVDSSQLVFTPNRVSTIDMEVLEEESNKDMKATKSSNKVGFSPSTKPWSSTRVSTAVRKLSSLDAAASRASSLQLSASRKPSLGLINQFQTMGSSGATVSKHQDFPPHGFRYHSNGDERVSRTASSTRTGSNSCLTCAGHRAEAAAISFSELTKLRDKILRPVLRSRAASLSKLEARTAGAELRKKRQQEEIETPGLVRLRKGTLSEPAMPSDLGGRHSSALAAARDTDNMFKRTILRHLHDMAQSTATSGRSLTRVPSALSSGTMASNPCACAGGGSRISLFRAGSSSGGGGGASGRGVGGAQTSETAEAAEAEPPQGDCLTAGNSSFNMRYGVPVKLMALRKHILDEQHFRVVEEAQKNNAQVEQFLIGVQCTVQQQQQQSGRPGNQDTHHHLLDLDRTSPTIQAVRASNYTFY